jgi:hypothetical protein
MLKLAAVVVLAGTFLSGCCWPLEEGRHRRYGYGESSQWSHDQAPERRGGDEAHGWRDAPPR